MKKVGRGYLKKPRIVFEFNIKLDAGKTFNLIITNNESSKSYQKDSKDESGPHFTSPGDGK